MKIALSLSFLLIKTESNFFKSGKIEIANILKLGTAAKGFPWILTVFSYLRSFNFYNYAKSMIKLQ